MMISSRTGTCVDKTNDTNCFPEFSATETTTAGKLESKNSTAVKKKKKKKGAVIEFLHFSRSVLYCNQEEIL